ncbi:MAG: glycosyltransferase family 2 protein [Acidimicrobiia bacterium]
MTGPAVSVVVACFDRPDGVAALVAALGEQTVSDFELIAVDQVGDQRVKGVLDSAPFATRYLTEIPSGPSTVPGRLPSNASRARNTGALAAAPIVVFTDDDCVPEPDWLELVTEPLRTDPGVIAVTGPNRVLHGADRLPAEERFAGRRRPHLFAGQGGSSNLAVRDKDFFAVGGFDTSIGPGTATFGAEDQHLIWRLLIRAEETGGAVACRRDAAVTDRVPASRGARLRQRWTYWASYGRFLRREFDAEGETAAADLFHDQSKREAPRAVAHMLRAGMPFGALEALVSDAALLWGWHRGPRLAPFVPEVGASGDT